jgi:hypothetical protein
MDMHQRGPALVRFSLFCLFAGALIVALVQPSLAGTPDSPEVQDATGDVAITGGLADRPAGVPFLQPANFDAIDIVKAYVSANNTTVKLTLQTVAAPSTDATAKYNLTFNITTGADTTTRSVQRLGTAVTGPTGTAATASGTLLNFTVPATSLGVITGSTLSKLVVNTALTVSTIPQVSQITPDNQQGTDTAGPSTVTFAFNGPSADDTDADGIPDDCEILWFNSTATKSDPAEDEDGDRLTLGEECALGTDPTNADSDGDGVDDKKDPFPTDSTKGGLGSSTTKSSTSGTKSGSSSGTKSGSGSGSGSSTDTGSDDEGVKNFGDAVEKLKGDVSYLGTSAGAFVAVLILAIIALAVRWSL